MLGAKNKILIIDNSIAITGALKAAVSCSLSLKNNFDFTFILPAQSRASEYVIKMGFTVTEIPMMELKRSLLSMLMYGPMLISNTLRLFRLVKEQRIDIIHVNDFYNMLPPLYKFFGGKRPYLCHARFMPDRFPKILFQMWSYFHRHYAFSVIAVSQALRRQLVDINNVRVIGDGLPADNVPSSSPPSKVLLYPANFIRGKGQEHAIQSFAAVAKKYPDWKLRFVGGDMGRSKNADFKKELMVLATTIRIGHQIEWRDFSDQMASQYAEASVVLNFSESESFSLTCLEGLFYGRPVIATDSGGPAEIIDQGESGFIVPKGDEIAMSHAIDTLMSDEALRQRMGSMGRERVKERYGLERTAYVLRDQYLAAVAHDKTS